MGVDFFRLGIDFAEYCTNKYCDDSSFEVLWHEYSRFGIFDKFTSSSNLTLADKVQLMKGLGYGNGKVGILFSINVQIWACIMPLIKFAYRGDVSECIRQMQKGDCIGAHAISEPESGSDVFGMKTAYEKKEDGYHLNGTKCFVSNAPVADVFLVYARKNGETGLGSISCFLVKKGNTGLYVGRIQEKMGMNASPFGDVVMKDCVVSESMLVGKEGQGMNVFNYTMIHERPLLLAFQVGIMERQLADCIKYVKTRKINKKRLIQHDSVSNRIADMKTRTYISNLILMDCVEALEQNQANVLLKSSMGKLSISEMLCSNCMDAMRNYGTFGYTDGYNVAAQLKDSIGSLFYSGTSDIQRKIISSLL